MTVAQPAAGAGHERHRFVSCIIVPPPPRSTAIDLQVHLKSRRKCGTLKPWSDALTIGEVAAALRRGHVRAALLRGPGADPSERTDSGHRRYPRAVIRRVAFIVFAQKIGLSLEEIRSGAGEAAAQSRAGARGLGEALGRLERSAFRSGSPSSNG